MRYKLINLILVLILTLSFIKCSFSKNESPTTPAPVVGSSVPNTPSPANGATNQALYVTLKWECDNAIEYDVYIGESNPPLIKYTTTTNKSYTTPILKYNTQYFWQIVAKLNDGSTSASPVWSFITATSSSTLVNGFALSFNKIETFIPHNVKSTFQVVDLNGSGVTNLKVDDFEVFEDYQPLSKAESDLTINNHPTVYNQIRTVLMLDNSTSVETDINKIKTAATTIVQGIRPNQEIAIFQFSDKITMLQDFTNSATDLVDAINTKYTPGVKSTDFYGAVIFGTSKWKDEYSIDKIIQGCMVMITDGNDTQGSNTLDKAMFAVHNKLVITIGLGNELQPEILKNIGTGGYYLVGQESQVVDRFKDIQQALVNSANSFYDLSYQSPKRGPGTHTLQIRIVNNPYIGDKASILTTFSSTNFY